MSETQAYAELDRTWVSPGGVLGELVAGARRRADVLIAAGATGREVLRAGFPDPGSFGSALRRPTVGVIAELKRRSPSKGAINDALDAPGRAAAYAAGGAAALSILTEPERFGGSLGDLTAARLAVKIPVLRKDFIVHREQLHEARAAGACAVLLIARALAPSHAAELADEAGRLGLDVLFEVRDEAELARGIAIRGCAIGVNTRNLETLEIHPDVGAQILPHVPADRVAIYESGIASRADVERAAMLGADAVLVGSALSAQLDGAAAVRALAGVPRVPRGPRPTAAVTG